MLSFLKDDRNKSAGGQTTETPAQTQPTETDGQVSHEDDYLVPAEHGKSLKQSTFVLIVLFVVGALCVWFMIKKTTPKNTSAAPNPEEAKIEAAISQLTGIQTEMTTKVDDIVGRFSQISTVDQVDVAELKKNPFRRDITLGSTTEPTPAEQENVRREEIQRAASKLQLFSIMSSPQGNCCMINDRILSVGQTIENFTVKQITSRVVELERNGITIQLKMSE
jgi:preprotein translocase subunit SecG